MDGSPNRSIFDAEVSVFDNENMRAQMDAANMRLVRVIVLLIVLLVGTNMFWAFIK